MLIKVCGMRDPDNISRLSALDIHWMGFIFYGASKRFTEYVPETLPRHIKKVGVFVDADGSEVLLEVHSQQELDHLNTYVDMVGVNNRNLGSFHTDVENSFRLAELLPKEVLKVSESGIADPQLIARLRKVGYRGFLIGETFMKEADPGLTLTHFKEAILC